MRTAVVLCVFAIASVDPTHAQSVATLAERVDRLERVVNSETLVELLQQVQRLQQEVQELRGELEVQTHELSQLKQRQRELYLDTDRRVTKLETAAPAPSADTNAATSSTNAETTPDASATVTANANTGEEREAYQKAFNLLKSGLYEDAAGSFTEFLNRYPAGEYSDNAQYWLGESYYVTSAFETALAAFSKLVTNRPNSAKVTHALLKMGYIYDELGDKETAIKSLNELIERFPTTTAARLAKERLQQIQ